MRPSSAGGNTFEQVRPQRRAERLGDRGAYCGSRDSAMITSVPTLEVRMISVFLKSMRRPVPSSIMALVEHLEEDLVHVGMGLLDLVEQDDAVGLAAHRLGQPAALAIADIARRRALQRRDGVRLLELATC